MAIVIYGIVMTIGICITLAVICRLACCVRSHRRASRHREIALTSVSSLPNAIGVPPAVVTAQTHQATGGKEEDLPPPPYPEALLQDQP